MLISLASWIATFPRLSSMDDLNEALPVMAETSCALVMDGEKLVGLLTRENVSEFLMLRQIRNGSGASVTLT